MGKQQTQNSVNFKSEFTKRFDKVSFGLASTALGIITLGNTWGSISGQTTGNVHFNMVSIANWMPKLTAIIGIILILCVIIKSFANIKDFYAHMQSGTKSSHLPVIFMVLMAIGEFFTGIDQLSTTSGWYYVGIIIWWIGIILQFVYLGYWLVTRTMHFDFKDIDASWVVPPVGIAVACAVTPNIMVHFGAWVAIMWYISVAFYFVQILFIMYRYLFVEPMHKEEMPSVGIIASPASLMLATYFATFGFDGKNVDGVVNPGPVMIFILIGMSLFFIIIGYISMARVWKTKFTPGLGSYTFPTAVSALAAFLFSVYAHSNLSITAQDAFLVISMVELVISTLVIAYVLFGNAVMTITALSRPSNGGKLNCGFMNFYTHSMYK